MGICPTLALPAQLPGPSRHTYSSAEQSILQGRRLDQEQLVSLAEAASEFGLSAGHLRYLVSRQAVPGRKIGRNWVTTRSAVAGYMRDSFKRSKNPRKYRVDNYLRYRL